MITNDPLVSVVVPTFNRRNDLVDCIEGLLKQTYKNFEVIVVDNNSTDDTRELVLNRYSNINQVRYVCEKNQGLSFAKNRGTKESKGEIVAFMDDDAVPIQTWLEACVQAFINEEIVGVGGLVMLDWQKRLPPRWERWNKARTFLGEVDFGNSGIEIMDWLPGGNSAFRKCVIEKAGNFSYRCGRSGSKLLASEDIEFSRRVLKLGKLYYEPNMLIYHKVSLKKARLSYVFRSAFWVGVSKVIIKRPITPAGVSDVVGKDAVISFFSGAGYLYGWLLKIFRQI